MNNATEHRWLLVLKLRVSAFWTWKRIAEFLNVSTERARQIGYCAARLRYSRVRPRGPVYGDTWQMVDASGWYADEMRVRVRG